MISIVIPIYNGDKHLEETIKSCLKQTYTDIEIIVVDDAGTDQSPLIAKTQASYDRRVRILSHSKNCGVAKAFNTGFNAAQGEYFTRLAQDDCFLPNAIQTMASVLEANPDIDMVYADMELIDAVGRSVGIFHTKPPGEALNGCNGLGVCWMFRRSVWERESRGFDPEFDQIEDFEFWMRAKNHSKLMRLEGPPLLQFRQHQDSGSARHAARMDLLTAKVLAHYAPSPITARKALANGAFNASWTYRSQGKFSEARQEAWNALRYNPKCFRYYQNVLATLLKINHGTCCNDGL